MRNEKRLQERVRCFLEIRAGRCEREGFGRLLPGPESRKAADDAITKYHQGATYATERLSWACNERFLADYDDMEIGYHMARLFGSGPLCHELGGYNFDSYAMGEDWDSVDRLFPLVGKDHKESCDVCQRGVLEYHNDQKTGVNVCTECIQHTRPEDIKKIQDERAGEDKTS